jgi:hypothetical protein
MLKRTDIDFLVTTVISSFQGISELRKTGTIERLQKENLIPLGAFILAPSGK